MRNDPGKSGEFRTSNQWDIGKTEFQISTTTDTNELKSNSFSGHERNRMFMQTVDNFEEVSHVSGADFREDGRGFSLFDFDRDGWIDMGVVSANQPRFRLMRNTIGDGERQPNRAVFIKLVGGQTEPKPQSDWSPRDPVGARILVSTGPSTRAFQLSCGEGLSSQNSKWIHVGLGQLQTIDRVQVFWPSGKTTSQEHVPAGTRLTLFENPAEKQP